MAVSIRQFNIELYQEHLEEASALYEQRLSLLHDPEITWKDLAAFEDRFEAHIDALVVGGEPALEVCKTQALEGDFGELHAAVRVFCRQNKGDYVGDAWRDLDPEDMERIQAMADALKDECPDDWQESLTSIFTRDYFHLMPVIAPLFGHRRFKAENAMLPALKKAPVPALTSIVWALGRIGGPASRAAIIPLLEHPDKTVLKTAAESLLRLEESRVVDWSVANAMSDNCPLTALGLGGGRSAAKVLLDRIKSRNADEDALIALGLLGDLSAVTVLYAALENEPLARAAATGLYLLTGAEIYEEVYIPEEIDEDELFEEELEAYRNEGKVPTKPDGQPFGENVHRLSQNPLDWQHWLQENRSRFDPNQRYRLGAPYSPAGLLQTLLSETTPHCARALALDEFKIRYGADFPIEADMPVVKQIKIIPQIQQWVQTNATRFQPGAWYFAGRLSME